MGWLILAGGLLQIAGVYIVYRGASKAWGSYWGRVRLVQLRTNGASPEDLHDDIELVRADVHSLAEALKGAVAGGGLAKTGAILISLGIVLQTIGALG